MYIGDVGNNADDSDSAVGGVDGALDECQWWHDDDNHEDDNADDDDDDDDDGAADDDGDGDVGDVNGVSNGCQ